jgi:hypothetical protein
VDVSLPDSLHRRPQLHDHRDFLVATSNHLLSRHANHAQALLSKLRISPLSLLGTSIPFFDPAVISNHDFRMMSPFTSPPPPYSPEHPHAILDHEKVPAVMADLPPPLCEIRANESPKPRGLRGKDGDIFHLTPSAALTLLARYAELLVSMTGDLLPTPPPSNPTTPSGIYTERRNSEGGYYFGPPSSQNVDGIRIRSPVTPPASECGFDSGESASVIHHGGVDDTTHYGTISRKFWSKSAPEIPIEDYLFRYERTFLFFSRPWFAFPRIHHPLVCIWATKVEKATNNLQCHPILTCDRIQRFCPLSTAVYLAASYYLHRLAITDRIIPLTRLNVHRLLLAALRIAAKMLEDLSYPHTRFAKVGGLYDFELSKLEVSFCFLMDFELKVDRTMLQCHADFLKSSVEAQAMLGKDGLVTIWSA